MLYIFSVLALFASRYQFGPPCPNMLIDEYDCVTPWGLSGTHTPRMYLYIDSPLPSLRAAVALEAQRPAPGPAWCFL